MGSNSGAGQYSAVFFMALSLFAAAPALAKNEDKAATPAEQFVELNPFMAPVMAVKGRSQGGMYRPMLVYLMVDQGGAAKKICLLLPRIRDVLTAYFYSNPVRLGGEPGVVDASYEQGLLAPLHTILGDGVVEISLIEASSGQIGLIERLLQMKSGDKHSSPKVISCRLSK